MHVGQAEIASLEAVGELGVIETKLMQDGRVQIMHMDDVLDGVEAELIRFAVRDPRLKASPATSIVKALG